MKFVLKYKEMSPGHRQVMGFPLFYIDPMTEREKHMQIKLSHRLEWFLDAALCADI